VADLLSLAEAADLLEVSVEQIYQLMVEGELTSVRRGGKVMAVRLEIERRMDPDS
jgi:excisionase family DNA binding protein